MTLKTQRKRGSIIISQVSEKTIDDIRRGVGGDFEREIIIFKKKETYKLLHR